MLKGTSLAVGIAAFSISAAFGQTWEVDKWTPAYDFSNSPEDASYTAVEKASKKWNLCVIFPHLKDPYWVATNYGVVAHAQKIGVAVDLFEAGGYPNLEKQKQQVADCADGNYDAILLGTVSHDQMTPTVVEASKKKPVFATVNAILPDGISGMAAVDWRDMGRSAGRYFSETYPKGSDSPKVAWLPGPESAGWVKFTDEGFREVVKDSSIDLVAVKYGDTGKEIQQKLVEDVLEEHPDVDYIAGNAVAIEVAMSVVRQKGLKDKVKLVSDYFTPAIYRGIRRGLISSAPTDSAALQGMISVDQAVRFLEGSVEADHVGPAIFNVNKENVKSFTLEESLAPSDFKPTFKVD
ncbi:TMAO reductase system periplasmic protein TorT [Stappia sp. BW2]|jgi:protein TorT|uniref:TMAO reductase system periplasmic protein TorT n=1 Tax=Stappia sp. BW2 TaxID=2592622 RepID=UPI0011DE6D07|nr:TMAO reductase system periplasmic protein TorT [Stappia sp. BW2]TYC70019.1 TMAO reductase system periplasmic protein TorT [Stappia sp. BW2]